MKELCYELHAHTAEVSPCGYIAARKGVAMYKEAGYQGMVVTDHFHEEYFAGLGDLPWEEKIHRYLEGYRQAHGAAQELDMDVFWGLELRFTNGPNDYLVYGLDEEFLCSHPDLYTYDLPYLRREIGDRRDVLIFQAHPFRETCTPAESVYLDGMEIFNGNPRHDSENSRAQKAAEEEGLLIISASDFHRLEDLASGGIRVSRRIRTQADLITTLGSLKLENLIIKECVWR